MWDCDNCGTTNIAPMDFCPHCFAPRVTAAPAEETVQESGGGPVVEATDSEASASDGGDGAAVTPKDVEESPAPEVDEEA